MIEIGSGAAWEYYWKSVYTELDLKFELAAFRKDVEEEPFGWV